MYFDEDSLLDNGDEDDGTAYSHPVEHFEQLCQNAADIKKETFEAYAVMGFAGISGIAMMIEAGIKGAIAKEKLLALFESNFIAIGSKIITHGLPAAIDIFLLATAGSTLLGLAVSDWANHSPREKIKAIEKDKDALRERHPYLFPPRLTN